MKNKLIIKIKNCVQFKQNLHSALFKKSGAKDLQEYNSYINDLQKQSSSIQNGDEI